jgi:hypothetical protein
VKFAEDGHIVVWLLWIGRHSGVKESELPAGSARSISITIRMGVRVHFDEGDPCPERPWQPLVGLDVTDLNPQVYITQCREPIRDGDIAVLGHSDVFGSSLNAFLAREHSTLFT